MLTKKTKKSSCGECQQSLAILSKAVISVSIVKERGTLEQLGKSSLKLQGRGNFVDHKNQREKRAGGALGARWSEKPRNVCSPEDFTFSAG